MPRPVIDSKKCKLCKTCIEICPMEVFAEENGKIIIKKPEACIGCKACILACPYDARQMWDGKGFYFGSTPTPYELQAYTKHVPGAVQKCDFCADRLDQGLKPYCAETCLTGSLIFGDLDDPNSEVSQALREPRTHFRLKEELGTRPSIYFLA